MSIKKFEIKKVFSEILWSEKFKTTVGRPILVITRMITDRIHSVLLPSLLYIELPTSFVIGESVQPIFEFSACDVIQL